MRTLDIHLPTLHPAQIEIRKSPARFKVVNCGRRFGKTALSIDTNVIHLIHGQRCAYFMPSYKQGEEVWQEYRRVLEPIISDKDENNRRIETVMGGVFEMWSMDNENTAQNARGRKYHHVDIDEAASIPNLKGSWDAVIRPMLTDYRGSATFYSTPKGRNDFWHFYTRGSDPEMKSWASWTFPSIANPHMPPQEIEEARIELPERIFAQEYLAQFLDDGSGVFRGIPKITTAPLNATPNAGMKYVMGTDWGRQNDFTALVVFEVETMRMVDIDRFNQISWYYQRDRLKQMASKWGVCCILAEQNSIGDVNIEALQREGLPVISFLTTSASKPPLIENLAAAIERQEIYLQPDPVLLNELNAYTMKRSATGRWQYEAPSGGHDDTVIALALAYDAALRNKASGSLEWLSDW